MKNLEEAINFHKIGDFKKAENIYKKCLKDTKDIILISDIFQLLGTVSFQKKNLKDAEVYFLKSLESNSKNPLALNNLGLLYKTKKNYVDAEKYFKTNINLNDFLDSYINYFNIIIEQQDFIKLLPLTKTALKKYSNNSRIKLYYALALFENNQIAKSIDIFDQILLGNNLDKDSLFNYSLIMFKLDNLEKSLTLINKCISLFGKNLQNLLLRHSIFQNLNNFQDAEQDLLSALKIDQNSYEVKKAFVLYELKRENYNKAKKYCEENLNLTDNINKNFFKSIKVLCEIYTGDYLSLASYEENLDDIILLSKKYIKPLDLTYVCEDAEKQMLFSNFYWENVEIKKKIEEAICLASKQKSDKIVVGFFSGDIRKHAIGFLIKDLFLYLDKNKFEIIIFSSNSENDSVRNYVEKNCSRFLELDKLDSNSKFKLVTSCNLDVAIDLSGYSKFSLSWLFKYKIAKIKINFLGYPGTMGTKSYDYILTDNKILPKQYKHYYTEEAAYLPGTYQPFTIINLDNNEKISKKNYELPENTFLLVSFSRVEKITIQILNVWMEILNENKNTKLVLNISDEIVINNIKKYCEHENFDFQKIIFIPRLNYMENLKRMSLFDLYLDTYPYNSHTTMSDSLFHAKVPAVTFAGKVFQSRVSYSLMSYAGLDDLVTFSLKDYKTIINKLIQDNDLLKYYKNKLIDNLSHQDKRMIDYTRSFEANIKNLLNI